MLFAVKSLGFAGCWGLGEGEVGCWTNVVRLDAMPAAPIPREVLEIRDVDPGRQSYTEGRIVYRRAGVHRDLLPPDTRGG